MIYQVVSEPFSTTKGLALAAMASNVLRYEEESIVVCPSADGSYDFAEHRILKLPVLESLAKVRGWRYVPLRLRSLLLSGFFAPLLRRLKPGDTVWFHNWAYVAEALARPVHARGAYLLFHAHNSHFEYASSGGFSKMNADAMLFCSEAMRQEVVQLYPALKGTHTVHNGINEKLFFPATERRPANAQANVLFVGRLTPEKGAHVLLEAIRVLQSRGVGGRFQIVGSAHDASSRGKPTPYVEALKADPPANTEFVGFCDMNAIAERYRSADILCCPSVWQEPFGNVNIEAMACGVPVVASRVGGIPEIAADGGILLVEPDNAEKLADALQLLMQDPGLREKVGQEGRAAFLKRFTSAAVVQKSLGIVRALQPATAVRASD